MSLTPVAPSLDMLKASVHTAAIGEQQTHNYFL